MNNMEETFGEKLKDLRQEKEIGQLKLAKDLGVGKSVISYWEIGARQPSQIRF